MRGDVPALAAADRVEVAAAAEAARRGQVIPATRRCARGRVVLLRATDVIRLVICRDYPVELSGRVLLVGPSLAAVDRDVPATVVGIDHAIGVRRRDPQVVVVTVRHIDRGRKRLSAIVRPVEPGIERVDHVFVLRVGVDTRVIEGALAELAFVVPALPAISGIIRTEDAAARLMLDEDPDPLRDGSAL